MQHERDCGHLEMFHVSEVVLVFISAFHAGGLVVMDGSLLFQLIKQLVLTCTLSLPCLPVRQKLLNVLRGSTSDGSF